MKIGILTLPLHTNYGGILQAYALQTVLERMGNEIEVIGAPIDPNIPLSRRILSIIKRIFIHYVLRKENVAIDRVKTGRKKALITCKETHKFIDKHINYKVYNSLKDIHKDNYQAIVVGSDQIWRSEYNHRWLNQKEDDVYLGFTKGWNIKRIAYAASFGTSKIEVPDAYLSQCKEVIKMFDAVSTREESGVSICEDVFGIDAVVMPDPTLLISKEVYEALIPNYNNTEKKHELLSYILDDNPDKTNLRNRIARDKGLTIKITNKADYNKEGSVINPQPPVEEWLRAFALSDYVITDSFHASVFSIIFHKQFTVIANNNRGVDRFTTLLKIFQLEDRLISSPNDYKELPDIDYTKVDKILEVKRKEAYDFLKTALSE